MKWFLSLACAFLCLAVTVRADEVPVLARQLKDNDTDVRRSAAKSLSEMGPEASPAVPDLVQALKDRDLFVRRFSAQALGEIGPDARPAVSALKATLGDTKKEVAEAAAVALGKVGSEGVTVLVEVVQDKKQDVEKRKAAIEGIARAGAGAKDAVPALIDLLKDESNGSAKKDKKNKDAMGANLRVEAAEALGDIGPDAKDAASTLEDLAQMKGKSALKTAAKDALKKITGKTVGKKKK